MIQFHSILQQIPSSHMMIIADKWQGFVSGPPGHNAHILVTGAYLSRCFVGMRVQCWDLTCLLYLLFPALTASSRTTATAKMRHAASFRYPNKNRNHIQVSRVNKARALSDIFHFQWRSFYQFSFVLRISICILFVYVIKREAIKKGGNGSRANNFQFFFKCGTFFYSLKVPGVGGGWGV